MKLEFLKFRYIFKVGHVIGTLPYIHSIKLKDAIRSAKGIEVKILDGLKSSQAIGMLGIEILGANILAIQATPEMARALETETREKLQQEADQAIYERRNFAVEQERKIKETELNTEIAVEEKQKQIAEKKMESNVQKADNDRKLREMKVQADISIENQKKLLIEQKTANDKKEADITSLLSMPTSRHQPYFGLKPEVQLPTIFPVI